jgi:hypothetical protein
MSTRPSRTPRHVLARAVPLLLLALGACRAGHHEIAAPDASARPASAQVDAAARPAPTALAAADPGQLQEVTLLLDLPGPAGAARAISPTVRWTRLGRQLTLDARFDVPNDGSVLPARLYATARVSDDRATLLYGELTLAGERHRLTGQVARPACDEAHCWQLVTARGPATQGEPVAVWLTGR